MFYFIVVLIWTAACFAQPFPPDSVWTFGFDDGGDEYFYDAIEVSDGYLLCGEAREWNALAGEALLVKIDFSGELVWERRYENELARFRRIFDRSNTLVVFRELLLADGRDIGLEHLEINQDGDSLSSEAYGFNDGRVHIWGDAYQLGDNQFDCAFNARRDNHFDELFLQRNGSSPWHHTNNDYYCNRLTRWQDDGEYLITGRYVDETGNEDGFLSFLQDDHWSMVRVFGGVESDEFFSSNEPLSSTAVGRSYSYSNGSSDLWLFHYNNWVGFDSLWSRNYGGLAYEDGVEIVNADDEGFIIAGNFSSEDIDFEQSDFWLLKVDEDGDSVWSVVKGGDEADRCEGMIETENGFLLFGSSQSFAVPGWDGCAMFLGYVPDIAATPASLNFGPVSVGDSATRTLGLINTGSNVLTVNEIVGTENYSANFTAPATVAIGETLRVEIVFAPTTLGTQVDTLRVLSDAISGVKMVRCLGAGTAADTDDLGLVPTEFKLHPPYPNPFNPTATIAFDVARDARVELTIFDVQGRVVETLLNENLSAGQHSREWTCSTCAGGVYFARLRTSEFVGIQKMVLLK